MRLLLLISLLLLGNVCKATIQRDDSPSETDQDKKKKEIEKAIEEKKKERIKQELKEVGMPNFYTKKDIFQTFETAINLLFKS